MIICIVRIVLSGIILRYDRVRRQVYEQPRILPDDPWALLRQTIGSLDEDISFDRDQPLIMDLPVREKLV